jgi:hypothetical protein
MEDNNPSYVSSEDDVASEEVENVSTPDVLGEINKASGRNYKSLEEALGGVKETFSFVGKKAEPKNVAPQLETKDVLKEEVANLRMEVGRNSFLSANPEAKDFADEIGSIAKAKGVSWQEAYDNSRIKSLVKERNQAGEETPMVSTGQRLRRNQNVDVSTENFRFLSPDDQRKVIEKMPTWNRPLKDTEWNNGSKPRNYDL